MGYILFGLVALVAIVSAVGMLLSTNAIHAALFLVINLICIALFYLGLNAPFLAMVQITVYAGAIMVLFLFVIMLLGAEQVTLKSQLKWQAPLAIVLAVVMIAATFLLFFNVQASGGLSPLAPISEDPRQTETFGSPYAVGEVLFGAYLLPFEMTGVLLLVAMIGAIILTRNEAGGMRDEQRAASNE
ncbi:MAG: NADH-quinone oxidoreductase subunit J [Anaerolineae bacterium]|nr:NADH-quinone oxidoreductase subunit J [Anaerolineae bacterium]